MKGRHGNDTLSYIGSGDFRGNNSPTILFPLAAYGKTQYERDKLREKRLSKNSPVLDIPRNAQS